MKCFADVNIKDLLKLKNPLKISDLLPSQRKAQCPLSDFFCTEGINLNVTLYQDKEFHRRNRTFVRIILSEMTNAVIAVSLYCENVSSRTRLAHSF